jgi:hypothetical protein
MMKRHIIQLIAVAGLASLPFTVSLANAAPEPTTNYLQLAYNLSHNTNLSPKAVQMAFAGYDWALHNVNVRNKNILTIVDYSVSSAKPRMYVLNVKTGEILMSLAVAHGKGSGHGPYATKFSNKGNSLASRLGVFLTMNTYYGHHGRSLRIRGLEASNDTALSHNVVVHSANYVTQAFIHQNGRAGNSWGCFAVDPKQSNQLIDYIKDGTVLYAYGPSSQYLASTKILSAHMG